VPLETETSGEHQSILKRYQVWFPPLLAFAGLAILMASHGKNWVYSLPFGENAQSNSQTLWIKTDMVRGVAEVPKAIEIGAPAAASGRLGIVDPSHQPQSLIVYLDEKPVGQTEVFYPVLMGMNSQNLQIESWRVDFFMKNVPPGNYVLALQAVLQGHDPIMLMQTPVSVFR